MEPRTSAKVALSGLTVLAAEAAAAGFHAGGVGAILAAAAGVVVYHAASDIENATGRAIALPRSAERKPGQHSIGYRLLNGKSVREQPSEDGEEQSPTASSPQLAPPSVSMRAPTTHPAFFTFSDLLSRGFQPSLERIYLATLEDERHAGVAAKDLCHVAVAGLTRGGKSHIIRNLMLQLCVAGAEIYHLDPHYTPYDLEARGPDGKPCPEDWTPFLPYLSNDPRELVDKKRKYEIIEHYLSEANTMVENRMVKRGKSEPVGSPVFIFIDELPAIVDHIPDAPSYLKAILREGAKVGVYIVTASQDFLVKTLFPNEGGAIRDCYRTVLYVGGDATTAKVLLDMPAKEVPENALGKGRVMLRCDVVRPAQEARVPYVDNEALYALLGPSTYTPSQEPEEEDELVGSLIAPPAPHDDVPRPAPAPRSGPRVVRPAAVRKQERDERLRGSRVVNTPRPAVAQEDGLIARAAAAILEGKTTQAAVASAVGVGIWEIRKQWPDIQAEIKRLSEK